MDFNLIWLFLHIGLFLIVLNIMVCFSIPIIMKKEKFLYLDCFVTSEENTHNMTFSILPGIFYHWGKIYDQEDEYIGRGFSIGWWRWGLMIAMATSMKESKSKSN